MLQFVSNQDFPDLFEDQMTSAGSTQSSGANTAPRPAVQTPQTPQTPKPPPTLPPPVFPPPPPPPLPPPPLPPPPPPPPHPRCLPELQRSDTLPPVSTPHPSPHPRPDTLPHHCLLRAAAAAGDPQPPTPTAEATTGSTHPAAADGPAHHSGRVSAI